MVSRRRSSASRRASASASTARAASCKSWRRHESRRVTVFGLLPHPFARTRCAACGALHEAEPFGDVPREDQSASVAAPGDVRSRQHLQGRHTNELSSDETSQGEVGRRDHFHILELDPLCTIDHLRLQGQRASRATLPCARCQGPRSSPHSCSPPAPAALGLSGASCPLISPGRPPPPGGSGQGPASQETSHPANWAEQSADVRGVALTKPIILPSPLVCWHAAWQQPTSCARAVESPTSNPTPSTRPGLTSRCILISTSVLWDVGMSDERKKWAIQRARRGRRWAGDVLVNQAKRAHDRRRRAAERSRISWRHVRPIRRTTNVTQWVTR